jgi:hypothetical protein
VSGFNSKQTATSPPYHFTPSSLFQQQQQQQQQQRQQQSINHTSTSPSSSISYPSVSPLSPTSPTSQLSSSPPIVSSMSPTSSTVSSSTTTSTTAATGVNTLTGFNSNRTQSTLNNISSKEDETALMSAMAAAANKTAPQIFSKYIESVHKAMHVQSSTEYGGYRSPSAASSDITTLNDAFSNDNDMLNDAATLMASSSSLLQPQQNETLAYNNTNFSKGFVEHRRQMFEKTLSASSSSSGTSTVAARKATDNNQQQAENNSRQTESIINIANNSNTPKTTSTHSLDHDSAANNTGQQIKNSHVKMSSEAAAAVALKSSLESQAASMGIGELLPQTNAANLVFTSSGQSSNLNATDSLSPRTPMQPFSHMNRASYKGECRRLMSRTNMETVAERAAHFEEIDPERYMRMRSKFEELESQYEEDFKKRFGNQPPPLGYFMNQVNSNNINMLNSFVDSIMMLPTSRSNSNGNHTTNSGINQNNNNNNDGNSNGSGMMSNSSTISIKNENNVATSANANANSANSYFNSDNSQNTNNLINLQVKSKHQPNSNNTFSPIYDEFGYNYDDNSGYNSGNNYLGR